MYDAIFAVSLTDVTLRSPTFRLVELFGSLVGWLYITIAVYLQWNSRQRSPWPFPIVFLLVGIGILFVSTRVLVPRWLASMIVTLAGYAILAIVGVGFGIWVFSIFPGRYQLKEPTPEPDPEPELESEPDTDSDPDVDSDSDSRAETD